MKSGGIMEDGEYLFESVHGALAFAYRFRGEQFTKSLMNRAMVANLARGPRFQGKGLVGLDGAAQAGLIRGLMRNLDPYELHMIEARFEANERERLRAMLFFMPVIIANMPTGVHSKRAADVLIQKWFGERLKLQDAAQEIGAHRNTVGPMWATTKQVLGAIWERAEAAAHRELQTAGIVP